MHQGMIVVNHGITDHSFQVKLAAWTSWESYRSADVATATKVARSVVAGELPFAARLIRISGPGWPNESKWDQKRAGEELFIVGLGDV